MIPFGVLALLAFTLLTCLFALIKGGQAERIGSAVILGNLLVSTASELLFRNQVISLSIDGITALILLMVAVRYASVWLGVVMLLYAIQFGLHATYFVLERPRDALHIIVNNVDFLAVSVCLAVGTVLSWRQRLRAAQLTPQPAP